MPALADWVAAYERAWASNDPAEIGALFTDDALYFTTPFREPRRGRDGRCREFTEWWMTHTEE